MHSIVVRCDTCRLSHSSMYSLKYRAQALATATVCCTCLIILACMISGTLGDDIKKDLLQPMDDDFRQQLKDWNLETAVPVLEANGVTSLHSFAGLEHRQCKRILEEDVLSVSIKPKKRSKLMRWWKSLQSLEVAKVVLGKSTQDMQGKALAKSNTPVNAKSASTGATQTRAMHQQHDGHLSPMTARTAEQVKCTLLLLILLLLPPPPDSVTDMSTTFTGILKRDSYAIYFKSVLLQLLLLRCYY